MNRYFRFCFVVLSLLLVAGCKKADTPQTSAPHPKEGSGWGYPYIIDLRADVNPAYRFLGQGFNLATHESDDVNGFTYEDVLDFSQPRWKPFPTTQESSIIPEFKKKLPNNEPGDLQREMHISWTKNKKKTSMNFSGGGTYRDASLTYSTNKLYSGAFETYTVKSKIESPTTFIYLSEKDPSVLEGFLTKNFVRDLKNASWATIVSKYGTHVAVGYELGAYIRFVLRCDAKRYSEEEAEKIEATYWKGAAKLSYGTTQKIEEEVSSIALTYSQGGSDYKPESTIFAMGNILSPEFTLNALSEKEWAEKIRPNSSSFVKFQENNNNIVGLVAIPDLISDIPMKTAYVTRILYETQNNVLEIICDPKTYEPILVDGKPLSLTLRYFDIGHDVSVDVGIRTDEEFMGHYRWFVEMERDNNLWTLYDQKAKKYFCSDGKERTEEEDTEGLRYLFFNPILPTEKGLVYSRKHMLIRKK